MPPVNRPTTIFPTQNNVLRRNENPRKSRKIFIRFMTSTNNNDDVDCHNFYLSCNLCNNLLIVKNEQILKLPRFVAGGGAVAAAVQLVCSIYIVARIPKHFGHNFPI